MSQPVRSSKLTPFEKTRVQIVGISPRVTDRILVGLNNRDAKWHDVHSLDLATGKLTPVLMNTGGYASFLADQQLVVRGALKSRADGGSDFSVSRDNKVDAEPIEQITLEDALTTTARRLHRRRQDALLARQPRPRTPPR